MSDTLRCTCDFEPCSHDLSMRHTTSAAHHECMQPRLVRFPSPPSLAPSPVPPPPRISLAQVDLEGHECRAFRGMTRLLNESTRILGAVVEFDKSHACCEELIRPPLGGFHLLRTRQGLCPVPSGSGSGGGGHAGDGKAEVSLVALCRLSSGSRQLNVRWKQCSGAVQ